ncbi:VirD4-like conjugal transfer protein, CD1115 family [Staphylococcus equorum]|uniref:VirD4-like conjugal transfer protein, CD1115 family n=1 Tax=Staphylococcus equorum TaxID=246432 RepID=UPI002555E4EA|nr:type IV secretory system conjugative DNA transfer family protein [Staphylococcus equorum]MDK9850193.1 type IV secretory system conjugative DNA transfer family protein [Staphylococcus equorum]
MNPFKKQHNHGYHRKKASFSQNKHILAHPIGLLALLVVGFIFIMMAANFFINMLNNLVFAGGDIFDNMKKINEEWTTYFFKIRFDLALFYIPFLALVIILWGKKVYQIRQKFKSLDNQEKASGRFSTKKEIKQQYKAIAQREKQFEGEGGLPVAMFGVYDFVTKTKQYLEQRKTANNEINMTPDLSKDERHQLKKEKLGQINKEFSRTFLLKREFTFIDESPTNNIFVGTSRSGKGEVFVLSMIENYSRSSHQPSLVVNDMKGELYSGSNETLENRNYHTEVFNLDQPMESTMSFNLLQLVIEEYQKGDLGEAQEMTKQITHTLTNNEGVEDNEWNLMSAALINAMILALCEEALPEHPERVTLYSVSNMLQTLSVKKFYKQLQIGKQVKLIESSALDEYMEKFPSHSPAKTQYATVEAAPDKMRSSIIGTALKALQPFTTDTIAKLTSHSSLDLNKLGFPSIIDGFSTPDGTFDLGVQVKRKTDIGIEYDEVEGIHIGVNEYGYWQYPFKTILDIGDRIEIIERDEFDDEVKYYFYVTNIDKKGHVTFETKGDIYSSNVKIRKFNSFSKPIAIFMVVPDYNSANHGIASILVNQIVFELSKNSQLYTENQSTHRRVIFHLDEAGNMPQIPNLAQKVNVSLSRGLRFNFFVQAFSQIKDVYGDAYDAIMDACQNKVFIMATQEQTLKDFSDLIGSQQITVRSRSGETDSLKSSITENQEERPLLRADELAHLQEGETVVVRNLKRQDNKRRKIMSYPIFNSGKYAMKYRYQYLADLMDTSKSILHFRPLLKERCEHRHLQLETTLVDWDKIIEDMQAGIEDNDSNAIDDFTNSLNKGIGEHLNTNSPESYKEDGNKKPVTRQKKVLTLKTQLSAEEFDRLTRRFTKTIRLYEADGNKIDSLTLYKLKEYLKLRVRNNDITEEQKNKSINYVKQLVEEAKAK